MQEYPLIREDKITFREYQLNIASSAAKANTLVILPTGLGKTMIALLVINEFLMKGKKVLFLAPTRPLCDQHYKTIIDYMKIDGDEVILLTGRLRQAERASLWGKGKVIVATPQCIKNDIKKGKISLEGVGLVVMDEVHRAVGNYAYTFVAEECKKSGLHILGLTASPGSSKDRIDGIKNLLDIKNIEIRSEVDVDVKEYVKPMDVAWITVELPREIVEIRSALEEVIEGKLSVLRKVGYIQAKSFKSLSKRVLMEIRERMVRDGDKTRMYIGISHHAALMNLMHAHELLETQGITAFLEFFRKLRERDKKSKAVVGILKDARIAEIIMKAENMKIEHPKLRKLLEVISMDKEKMRIVFVQYRAQIRKIVDELNTIDGIKAVQFVGKREGVTQEEQKRTIERFRNKEFNVLVASSIGEEGLDIPSVDEVIFYEPIPSEIRSIQRRGRTARTRAGKVIILITTGTRDEAYYWISRGRERKMRRIVYSMQKELSKSEEPQKKLSEFL
jgi:Fanconi anemia group M protein